MKTVKIFISSTFRDMNAERDVVMRRVLPRLRENAEKMGVNLQEVDLRWGVTEEQARRGEVERRCLEGIEECRPYFLCIIGARYGWIPCPGEIRVGDLDGIIGSNKITSEEKELLTFAYHKTLEENRVYCLDQNLSSDKKDQLQRILEHAGLTGAGKSITHKEIDYAVLEDSCPRFIIELDKKLSQQRKTSKLKPGEEALIRDFYVRTSGDPVWRLLPGITEDENSALLPVLKKAGMLIQMSSFFFFRKDDAKGFYSDQACIIDSTYLDQDERSLKKLCELKIAIRQSKKPVVCSEYICKWNSEHTGQEEKSVYPITALEAFSENLFNELWNHMQSNPELVQKEEVKTEFEEECDLHLKFINARTYSFYGRREMLGMIWTAVGKALSGQLEAGGQTTQTIMVTGEPGSGKSALLAKFYLDYTKEYPDHIVIPWFVGASFASVNPVFFLRHVSEILVREFNIKKEIKDESGETREQVPDIPYELNKLTAFFIGLLPKTDSPIVIIFDAVNQLHKGEGIHKLFWLPADLPKNICLILSLVEDHACEVKDSGEKDDIALDSLRQRRIRPFELAVNQMNHEERREMAVSCLRLFGKSLDREFLEILINKKEAHNPLFLHVALEELRLFTRHEALAEYITHRIPETVIGMFTVLLERIEEDLNRLFISQGGRNLFAEFSGFISLGRFGMSEEDLRLLLGNWEELKKHTEPEVHSKAEYDIWLKRKGNICRDIKISDYYWGELKRSLGGYLIQRGGEYDFFHLQLNQSVGQKYLATADSREECRRRIVDYLQVRGYEHFTTVRDLPHHLLKLAAGKNIDGEIDKRILKTICNVFFIEASAQGRLLEERQSNFEDAMKLMNRTEQKYDLYLFYSKFILLKHHLRICPNLVFQQFYNEFQWEKGRIKSLLEEDRKTFIDRGGFFFHQYRIPKIAESRLVMTLGGHDSVIHDCSFSPDGKYIVSSSSDKTIKIWDSTNGIEIQNLSGHDSFVYSCKFSKNGKYIISASNDTTLKLWESDSGSIIRTFSGHKDGVGYCDFLPGSKRIVSISNDGTIKIWDINSGIELLSIQIQKIEFSFCTISPDGKHIASGSVDNTLKIRDVDSGRETNTLVGHKERVTSCAFSPDSKSIISGSIDKTLKIWDANSGLEICTLVGHNSEIVSCDFSPNSERIISKSEDNVLKLWDAVSGREICTITGEQWGGGCSYAFSPDNKYIATGRRDGIKLWETNTGMEFCTLTEQAGLVFSQSFSPDSKRIISAGVDWSLKLWDMSKNIKITDLSTKANNSCRFSPDNTYIATAGKHIVKLWNVENAELIRQLTVTDKKVSDSHSFHFESCCFSSSGKEIIALNSIDNTLYLWNTESGQESDRIKGIKSYSFSNDDRYMVFEPENDLIILDFDKVRKMQIKIKLREQVALKGFSPDNKLFLSKSLLSVYIYQVSKRKKILSIECHHDDILFCSFSPDGRRIITASADNTLKIHNLKNGKEIETFSGHTSWVNACVFSPDGNKIISASDDNSLILWSINNGDKTPIFHAESKIGFCTISGDGKIIVCSDSADHLYFLNSIGYRSEIPIITGMRIRQSANHYENHISFFCPICKTRHPLISSLLKTISSIHNGCHIGPDDSPCLKLPDGAWEEPELAFMCPQCGNKLKSNPFVVDSECL